VERVLGDVRDPIRMLELVAGAEVVVLAMQGFAGPGGVSPRTVDQEGSRNVIAAAEQADADVVLLSIARAERVSITYCWRVAVLDIGSNSVSAPRDVAMYRLADPRREAKRDRGKRVLLKGRHQTKRGLPV